MNWSYRYCIFLNFCLMNTFLNYDTGVIPAALVQIQHEIQLSHPQVAYLGSLVYLGLCTSSLFVSSIFNRFSAPRVIAFNVFLNAIACFVFSMYSNLWILYAMRFLLGFTQAFVVIYAPVWINEFSPSAASTRWMAALNVSALLGVLLGYTLTAVLLNYFSHYAGWR